MSLKVWLPLNGNLNNQGLSNISVINENATINTAGKIGSCYEFNGSTSRITINYLDAFKGGSNPFTYCSWIYDDDNNARSIYFGDYGTTGAIGVNIEKKADNKIRFYWNGAPDKTFNYTVPNQTWFHLAITYDGTTIKCYANGILQDSLTQTLSEKNKTSGFYGIGRDSRSDTTAFKGKMNDLRIYDECLTQKQIKEIAKGLVCHYKLIGERPNRNYILNSAFSGKTAAGLYTFNEDVVTFETDAFNQSGSSFALSINPSAIENFKDKNLTFSMEYKIDTALTFGTTNPWVGFEFVVTRNATTGGSTQWLSWYGGKNIPTAVTDGWIKYSKTVFVQPEDIASVGINFYFRDTTGKISFRHPKIEIGTKATEWRSTDSDYEYDILDCHEDITTDCSGYGNNAIQNGNLEFNFNSPKYNGSTKFNSGYLHKIPSPLNSNSDTFTISCWFYPTVSGTQAIINDRKSVGDGLSIFYYSGTQMRFDTGSSYQWVISASDFGLNKWNFLTFTWDKNEGIKKYYLNGNLISSTTNYGTITNIGDVFSIGNSSTNGDAGAGNQIYGSLSDFRIYATVLSAEEILTLYKNSGIIDNNSDVYTREFDEPQIQSSLNQMPTNVNRMTATLTATLEEEPQSITGKATKFLCTAAGSGWYWSGWGKNDLINGEQYILTMYVKSPNRTAFRMNIEASSTGQKNYTIGTEYSKIEYPFTYNSTTSYSALTCYQSPAMAIDDEIWIHSVAIYKANEYNKNKINKNGIWKQNEFNERILPDGYTQLEYITGDGVSYIDTQYIPNSATKFLIKASTEGVSGNTGLFGARTSSSANPFLSYIELSWGGISNVIRVDINSNKSTEVNWIKNEPFIIEIDSPNKITKINNLIIPSYTGLGYTTSCENTLSLFAVHSGSSYLYPIKGNIYYCKIWDNNILVRDFIPALRNSDNITGLYDRINNIFYANMGTGEFKYILKDISSEDFNKIPSDYTRLNYLQSNGGQWINTGFLPKNGNKIIANLEFVSLGNAAIYGSYAGNYYTSFGLAASNKWEYRDSLAWRTATQVAQINTRYSIEFYYGATSQYLQVDGTKIIENTYSLSANTATINAALFARKTSGVECFAKIKLYNFQIWEDENTLVRDFIPVKRKNDGVLGLYDIINNVFYTNSGSGTFSPGSSYTESANVKIYKETNALEANEFWEI